MNIHEYQAKKILSHYGVTIPNGDVAYTPNEAKKKALQQSIKGPWVLKAQIQSGARSKGYFLEEKAGAGGGIRTVKSRKDLVIQAEKMLGSTLVTTQTGPKGKIVSRLYIEHYRKVMRNFYLAIAIDRVTSSLVLLIAPIKNESITNLILNSPEQIMRIHLNLTRNITSAQISKVMKFLKLSSKSEADLRAFINGVHKAFLDNDATMIEINPVGVMRGGHLVALDAKVSFDDNALYRHPDIKQLQDDYEASERALYAAKYNFNYSEFSGSIGCIVNGDGIALAAMDSLRDKGIGTACFLNVKGGIDKDKIAAGIKIVMTNPRVEGILINVLGGFLRCNLVAEGIIAAASEVGLNVPLVVRFEGTKKDEAKEILQKSNLPIIMTDTMEDAVNQLMQAMEESN